MKGQIYQFEDYLLEVGEQRLQKNGKDISLSPKVFDVLTVLLEHCGELVTHEELMESVWEDTFVEDTNLRYCIHSLRKTLDSEFIETVPKRGYRLNVEVKSFTKEEFIRHHTASAANETRVRLEPFPGARGKLPARSSSIRLIGLFLLVALGLGAFGIYRYNSKNADSAPDTLTSLAVFPFSAIGDSTDNPQNFQAGLGKEISLNLQNIEDVKTELVKDIEKVPTTDSDFFDIARSLGFERIIAGTFSFEEKLLRVKFRILDASKKSIIISKEITIERDSPQKLEEIVASRITREVMLQTMSLRDERALENVGLDDETKNIYLLSQRIPRQDEFNRWHESSNLLRKVVERKPEWALAKGKLAESLVLVIGKKGCPEATRFADEALKIDKETAQAHFVTGFCAQFDWNWELAEKSLLTAIKLKPHYSRVYLEYAHVLDMQKKYAEAESVFKKLLEIGPFIPFYKASACEHFYFDQKFDEAEKLCRASEKLDPGYKMPRAILQWMYIYRVQPNKILELEFSNGEQDEPKNKLLVKALQDGDVKRYVKLLANDPDRKATSIKRAAWYVYIGETEKALEKLENAVEKPVFDYYRINADPIFGKLKREKRYVELLESINIPKEKLPNYK